MKKIFLFLLTACFVAACSDDDEAVLLVDAQPVEEFNYAESKTFKVLMDEVESVAIQQPKGWKATLENEVLTVTAPTKEDETHEYCGKIEIIGNGDEGTVATSFDVKAFVKITFEDADPSYLAGPTSKGENLYVDYTGEFPYGGYFDEQSGLFCYTAENFWSGGIAISDWNDKEGNDWNNQCSVFYGDHNQKNGGNNHSKTFAVASTSGPTYVDFINDANEEHIFDHMYVMNSTYATLVMENGNGYGKKLTYENKDWFKLTITGVDSKGQETKSVEVYLADFRTPQSPGILKEWKRVDLSSLGKVHSLLFKIDGSDVGDYGVNTPLYFCMDDIALRWK